MSERDLVNSYLNGQITRRVFIRRLIGLGISASAALAYSNLLQGSPAMAATPDDFYDLYDFYCDPAHHDVKGIVVKDDRFVPGIASITPGDTAQWSFAAANSASHSVVDLTGMGLYDSGPKAPGSTFTYQFKAAGRYRYRSTIGADDFAGSVKVPPLVHPPSGSTSTTFTLAWACATAPSGFVYDVQLSRPSTGFQPFMLGTTQRLASFVPDAGPGVYSVRSRLRKLSNNRASKYLATPFTVS